MRGKIMTASFVDLRSRFSKEVSLYIRLESRRDRTLDQHAAL